MIPNIPLNPLILEFYFISKSPLSHKTPFLFRYTMLYAYNTQDYITYDLTFATVKARTHTNSFNFLDLNIIYN
jgi:hypothetical protein